MPGRIIICSTEGGRHCRHIGALDVARAPEMGHGVESLEWSIRDRSRPGRNWNEEI